MSFRGMFFCAALLLMVGAVTPSKAAVQAAVPMDVDAPSSYYATILDLDQRDSDPVVGFWQGPGRDWEKGGARRCPVLGTSPEAAGASAGEQMNSLFSIFLENLWSAEKAPPPALVEDEKTEKSSPAPPRLSEFFKNENLVLVLGDC